MGVKKVIYLNSYAEHKGIPEDEGVSFLNQFGVETAKYQGKIENASLLT